MFANKLKVGQHRDRKEFADVAYYGLSSKQNRIYRKIPIIASTNSSWAYIREGLLSEGFSVRLRFRGLIFFFWGGGGGEGGILSEFYGIFNKLQKIYTLLAG